MGRGARGEGRGARGEGSRGRGVEGRGVEGARGRGARGEGRGARGRARAGGRASYRARAEARKRAARPPPIDSKAPPVELAARELPRLSAQRGQATWPCRRRALPYTKTPRTMAGRLWRGEALRCLDVHRHQKPRCSSPRSAEHLELDSIKRRLAQHRSYRRCQGGQHRPLTL